MTDLVKIYETMVSSLESEKAAMDPCWPTVRMDSLIAGARKNLANAKADR